MEAITSFDQVPAALNYLINQVSDLKREITKQPGDHLTTDRWFDIEELSAYLPGHPAVTTIYGKVQRREIPFFREGKRLVFLQSQIDTWLKSKKAKTALELEEAAERQTTRQRRGERIKA